MMWRRHRGCAPALARTDVRTIWQVASLLLDYPTHELVGRVPALRGALAEVPIPARAGLTAYLEHSQKTPLQELQSDYIDTFDVTRRCALHLSYYTCGDTRKRGVELIRFKQAYRRSGVEMSADELPDHLCVILEFGAVHDLDIAWKLLCDNRVGIELLHRALTARRSAWLPVIETVRSTLPGLDGSDEEALARLIAEGPPNEEVGLDGWDPPPTGVPSFNPTAHQPSLSVPSQPVGLGPDIPVGAPR